MSDNIVLLINELLLPLILGATGFILWRFTPSYKGLGYHTTTSERSPATWLAANKYCGFRMLVSNLILLVGTVISWAVCVAVKLNGDGMAAATMIKTGVGVALMLIVIIMTEIMLHRCFDKNGQPK